MISRIGRSQHTLKLPDGVYTGESLNGIPHGKGQFVYTDMSIYTGSFVNGKKSGMGKITYPQGGYYDGEWK